MDNPVADKDWELPPKNKDWRFNDMERNFSDESFLLFFSNTYPNVFQEIAGAFHEFSLPVGRRGPESDSSEFHEFARSGTTISRMAHRFRKQDAKKPRKEARDKYKSSLMTRYQGVPIGEALGSGVEVQHMDKLGRKGLAQGYGDLLTKPSKARRGGLPRLQQDYDSEHNEMLPRHTRGGSWSKEGPGQLRGEGRRGKSRRRAAAGREQSERALDHWKGLHEFYAPAINLRSFSPGHLEFGGRKTGGRGKKMMMPGHYKFANVPDPNLGKKRGSGADLIRRLGVLATKPPTRGRVRMTGGLQQLHPNHPNYRLFHPEAGLTPAENVHPDDIHRTAQVSGTHGPSRPIPGTKRPMDIPGAPNFKGRLNYDPPVKDRFGRLYPNVKRDVTGEKVSKPYREIAAENKKKREEGNLNEFIAGGLIRAGLAVGKRALPAIGRKLRGWNKSLGRSSIKTAKAAGRDIKSFTTNPLSHTKRAVRKIGENPGVAAKSFVKGGLLGGAISGATGAGSAAGSALRKSHGSSRPTTTGADPSKAPKKRTSPPKFKKQQEWRDISSGRASKGLSPTTKPSSLKSSPTATATAGRIHRQRKHGFSPDLKSRWDRWEPKTEKPAGSKFPWMNK